MRKLLENATDLIQSAYSLLISEIKEAWTRLWEAHKVGLTSVEVDRKQLNFKQNETLKNPGIWIDREKFCPPGRTTKD